MCNIRPCCLPSECGPCLSPNVAGHPLRSATDRRLGGLLSHQLANQTRVHLIPPEFFTPCHATSCAYAVLPAVSSCYPPVQGRLPTRYSPVRHSVTKIFIRRIKSKCFVRLACVKHAASVHPEPGSNSHKKGLCFAKPYKLLRNLSLLKLTKVVCLVSYKLTSLNSFTKTYCLGSCIFRYSQDSLMNHFKILKEFQGCLSIQLSKIYSSNPVFIWCFKSYLLPLTAATCI